MKKTEAVTRYFDPYFSTGFGTYNMLDGFGFGSYSPAITFVLQPIYLRFVKNTALNSMTRLEKSGNILLILKIIK